MSEPKVNTNLTLLKMELWQKANFVHPCQCIICKQLLIPWLEMDQPLFVCKTFGCGYTQKCPDFIEKMKLEDLLDGMKSFSKTKKSALVFAESFDVVQMIKTEVQISFPSIDQVFGLRIPVGLKDLCSIKHDLIIVHADEEALQELGTSVDLVATSSTRKIPLILISDCRGELGHEIKLSPRYFSKVGFKHYISDIQKLIEKNHD